MSQSPSNMIDHSALLRQLIQKKKRFLIPMCLFFLFFYFSLPVLIIIKPEWMNQAVYGSISLAWIYAAAQCLMTLLLSSIYMLRARHFDQMAAQITSSVESEEIT
ncbi:DUF485 domain-containing protein [Brevibacillus panacihumi]|uniref:DUF485 domain-containing protein n=1 Tax=Brevibacillus panacihumi TaxID=497735 RepID=A0A3M8DH10_9BACL|nr:DUF485 domain-containing protein [Brevibacillus panacihumi]RNB86447.1 DUF485 domain-containing protein [Brevibacillus panacihumi]